MAISETDSARKASDLSPSEFGSLGFRGVTVSESSTCSGGDVTNPNKSGTPARYPCQLPKTSVFEATAYRELSLSALVWRRFRRHRLAMASGVVLLLMILIAVFAPVIAPKDPNYINYDRILVSPNVQAPLGTDNTGRDVWARLCFGARISLAVGLIAVVISQGIGILLGSVAGYYGHALDAIIMRATDVVMCFPRLVLMLIAVAVLGPGLSNTMMVIGITSWPNLCRLVRGEFLSLRERDFVLAAQSLGVPNTRLIFRHILPNVLPYLIVNATFGIAGAVMSEAWLSFLGLGVQVPTPSWGNMLSAAQSIRILSEAPWFWLPPGMAISLTVLAINFIGDGLRDALDPRALVD